MWALFLFLRLLSSSPVLVLSNRRIGSESAIVATYMSREDIPFINWKNYEDWTKGDCWEEGDTTKPFKKVYLWEDNTRWIGEDKWEKCGLLDKLEACEHIIEFNIDGGPYNEDDIEWGRGITQNYAQALSKKLMKTKWPQEVTITWYNYGVYGMDWLAGPYQPESHNVYRFIWKTTDVIRKTRVYQWTYLKFWNKLISETCTEIGKCFGILVAYADSKLISCRKLIVDDGPVSLEACSQAYHEYEVKVKDGIEPLVNYLENLKKDRKDNKGEL